SHIIGWPEGKTPVAPAGFTVTRFAGDLKSPRMVYVAPNGDVFVAEAHHEGSVKMKVATLVKDLSNKGAAPTANRITLFRDVNKNGKYEGRYTYLEGVEAPFGMVIVKDKFYLACMDAVYAYDYTPDATKITGSGKTITALAGNGRHWTRNIVANKAGTKLYVAVGSGTDHAEDGVDKEEGRAQIIEMNLDGSDKKIYANGLRNPCGMDWNPTTGALWTSVNERDELGDNLVPDYITSVKEGGFYGWPFSYYGQHTDPRIKKEEQRPDLVAKAIVPDMAVGPHTASLGFTFYDGKSFPVRYHGGAFIGQHGSWNRPEFTGYQVAFVPFASGKPSGALEPFLTGFIADEKKSEVYGRPVGVAVLPDGSLLVADDGGNAVWRVSAK
ncbi:MAG: sorbosone dehydrogenase family protein, partial [Bacteroidetes bacterium]|nr:sorbosone dehydrogenase family protein [Bacteroidota bacterium]